MLQNCDHCGKEYEHESMHWAKWKGQMCSGEDEDGWYLQHNDDLFFHPPKEELEFEVHKIYTAGFAVDYCGTCYEAYLDRCEQNREYESDLEPEWFDPADAGETW